jgi:hypothetical protein
VPFGSEARAFLEITCLSPWILENSEGRRLQFLKKGIGRCPAVQGFSPALETLLHAHPAAGRSGADIQ